MITLLADEDKKVIGSEHASELVLILPRFNRSNHFKKILTLLPIQIQIKMKPFIAFTLTTVISLAAFAQQKKELSPQQVPAEVKTSFQKDFPTAELLNWEKEGGQYEATFNVNRVEMSASYSKSGYRKEVEKGIEESQLPASIFDYIKKNYPGYTLKNASQITTDKAVVTYEAEVTKDNKTAGLIFDANGKFKKKEKRE